MTLFMNSKRFDAFLFFIICSLFCCRSVFAGDDNTLIFNTNPLIYNGPADAVSFGDQIGPAWVADHEQIQMCSTFPDFNITTAVVEPVSPPTAYTTSIDGVTYQVFSTGTEGIGWVMGVKDTRANNFTPLMNMKQQWYPAPGTPTGPIPIIGGEGRVTLVKVATHLHTGNTTLLAQNIAIIKCYGEAGNLVDSAFIKINSINIYVNATGCTVESSKEPVLDFGKFTNGQFPSIGSTSTEKNINIALKCNSNVTIQATLSDQSDLANRSRNIKLTSDSTAQGLAIQAFHNGESLELGPDDSSKGVQNQFFISSPVSEGQTIQVPLSFKYVRTGDISPGTANGLVGITFSYQ